MHVGSETLDAIYSMGYCQYKYGHYEEAAKAFQYLCIYDQKASRNFLSLGVCQQRFHLYGQAIDTFMVAADLAPHDPLPMIYIADCYMLLFQEEKAEGIYQDALAVAHQKSCDNNKEVDRAEKILSAIRQYKAENK